MKKILLAVLLAVLMNMASVSAQGPDGGPNGQRGGNRGGNGGGVDKSSDAELQKMITEIIPQFELVTWEDPETGLLCSTSFLFRLIMTRMKNIRWSSLFLIPV